MAGGTAVLDESFRRLQVSKIDLLQIHNLNGMRRTDAALPGIQGGRQDPLHRHHHLGGQPVRAAACER